MDRVLHVLVIDDELGMRLGAQRVLRRLELSWEEVEGTFTCDVQVAESGEEGLERMEERLPDLLFLDHKLPGISGLDVLEEIGKRGWDVLTVMITAYASLDTAITATKRGAFDFLAKPFTPDELRWAAGKAAKHLVLQREALKLAEEKRQVRFQFLSVLAHELKAPLGAVEGYLNLLADPQLSSDPAVRDQAVERSQTRIQGMRKMIGDLLDLTRIESGRKKRELAELDLRELAETAMETMQPDADARSITLALEAPAELTLRGDRGELEIILNNLVSNAVKYNRDEGRVAIRLRTAAPFVEIEVEDTGIGMTPEEADSLFGEFVRIKNKDTRRILGSGLGLSIVKKLATMQGGDITVRSERNVGTTFTVTLPIDGGEEGS